MKNSEKNASNYLLNNSPSVLSDDVIIAGEDVPEVAKFGVLGGGEEGVQLAHGLRQVLLSLAPVSLLGGQQRVPLRAPVVGLGVRNQ